MARAGRIEALLQRHWWRPEPSALAQALRPLSWIYGALRRIDARRAAQTPPLPVVVVGNLIVGGAGKTPTVIALVEALRAAGWNPGVVSRGYGSRAEAPRAVGPDATSAQVGDEPIVIARRSGVPVWVGRRRAEAARALCAAHPEVDLIVADDGLQHAALGRTLEIVVFDERGAGNGLLLPAGPLREPLPADAGARLVLYNAAAPSTPLAGALAARSIAGVTALADWHAGRTDRLQPLAALRGRRLLALAGIAAPERFFTELERAGLEIERRPLPDHHEYAALPWDAATPELVTTEKDAVKIAPGAIGATRVWVARLDFALPPSFIGDVLRRLGRPPEP